MSRAGSITWLLLSTAFTALCPLLGHADPPPTTSEYLHTFSGGFIYRHPTRSWTINLLVQPRKKSPGGGPLYLEATFQNPQIGGLPLVVRKSSLDAGKLGVNFETSAVAGMRDHKAYQVTVRIYGDQARTELLGTHQQTLLYHNIGDPEILFRRAKVNRPRA